LKIKPNDYKALLGLAKFYRDEGNNEMAVSTLKEILKIKPNDGAVSYLLNNLDKWK
jgi:Tfp pilus assembly protein PilF